MTYALNGKHVTNVLALAAPARYEYFIKRVADWQEAWTLAAKDGFVMSSDEEGTEFIPVWPHPLFAEMCALRHWSESKPALLQLSELLERWIPGAEKAGRMFAVFPLPEGGSITVRAQRLEADLREELSLMED